MHLQNYRINIQNIHNTIPFCIQNIMLTILQLDRLDNKYSNVIETNKNLNKMWFLCG